MVLLLLLLFLWLVSFAWEQKTSSCGFVMTKSLFSEAEEAAELFLPFGILLDAL